MQFDDHLDASGLLCPLPVRKAAARLKKMAPGAILRLTTTDPAAPIDVRHFCAEAGHALLSEDARGEASDFLIRRGG